MKKAVFAGTFDPFTLGHLSILKRAAAVAAQSVKRAVAEKTIEIFRVRALVAGKILAFFMRKIAVILRHIGSF